jgi:hypothetical protein
MLAVLQIEWERILDRFGWPTLILTCLVIIGRTVVWPIIKKKLEEGDKAAARVNELMESQILKADAKMERADKMQEGLLTDFKEAIDQVANQSKKQADLLEELLRRTPRQ